MNVILAMVRQFADKQVRQSNRRVRYENRVLKTQLAARNAELDELAAAFVRNKKRIEVETYLFGKQIPKRNSGDYHSDPQT